MKLQAKDIMLGNLLDFNGMECVVKEIDKQGVVVSIEKTGEEEWIDLFQFTPIPITEEYLLRFGFNNDDWSKEKYNGDENFKYTLQSGIFYRPLLCNPFDGWKVYLGEDKEKVCFRYVHELQNIITILNRYEFKN